MGRIGRALVVAACASLVVVAATPAKAMSCASPPDVSPAAVVEGREVMGTGSDAARFRDSFDGAAFGRVVAAQQHGRGESGLLGLLQRWLGTSASDEAMVEGSWTEVTVEVLGTLGPSLASPAVITWDGWGEHPFEVGEHYFLIYHHRDGRLHVSPCTPLHDVDGAAVPQLVATAQQHAWPGEAMLGGNAAGLRTVATPPTEESAWWPGIALAAIGVTIGTILVVRGTRRRHADAAAHG